jgi:hypothetical protein
VLLSSADVAPGTTDVRKKVQLLTAGNRRIVVRVECSRRCQREIAIVSGDQEVIEEGFVDTGIDLVQVDTAPDFATECADIPRFDREVLEPSAKLT